MQLAVMAVPKMIILAIKNQQIMIKVTKASKDHRNLIVVAEKTATEIIIEVTILMVNKIDVVEIVIIVVPEIHVKIMILEVSFVWHL